MTNIKDLKYNIKKDIEFIMASEQKNIDEISRSTNISRTTLYEILDKGITIEKIYDKFYSYIYDIGYRLNSVKEDFIKEIYNNKILFHGSKSGLSQISSNGSRENCDFGTGFYLGEGYDQAVSFVCENKNSCVYSFECNLDGLNIVKFDCSMEWMIAICYYRGTIKEYENTEEVKRIVKKIENADVIIAPIADNRMFYIMSLFASGEINCDVALHSLSASKLGKQYVFKTEKSLSQIKPIEKYYLCNNEKKYYIKRLMTRTLEMVYILRSY